MAAKEIDIRVIKSACDQIFNFILDDLKIEKFELTDNFYWQLKADDALNLAAEPTARHVGSLHDDYDFVAPLADDPSQALPLVLGHVAPLIQALSRSLPNFK